MPKVFKMKISNICSSEIKEVLELCAECFLHVSDKHITVSYLKESFDINLSKKMEIDGEIIGCYLFSKSGNKLHGLALAVKKNYRGIGYGRILRHVSTKMNFKEIFGLHYKGLNNKKHWIKFGRTVISETQEMFATNMKLKTIEDYFEFQPSWFTCGTTCVKMVANYYEKPYESFDELITLCDTNTQTGTIHTGIQNALNALNITNYRLELKNNFGILDKELESGSMVLLRTLMGGIKHWVICYFKSDTEYFIACPIQGIISMNKLELDEVWQPREYDGFVVKPF